MAISSNRANCQQKFKVETAGRACLSLTLASVRFRATWALSNHKQKNQQRKHCVSGRKSLLTPLKYVIPKTLCEMPKSPII